MYLKWPQEFEQMEWCSNIVTAPHAQKRGYATALLNYKTEKVNESCITFVDISMTETFSKVHAKGGLIGLAASVEENVSTSHFDFYLRRRRWIDISSWRFSSTLTLGL